MKFLFTCGGTAGHINPALGVAGRIRELMPDAEFLFVGAQGRMETVLVPREGYEIKTVDITNLKRGFSAEMLRHNLKTAKNVLLSMRQAREILKDFAPDVAVGTGGYVCYPVLREAATLGIPTAVHESNAIPGLTTKMLAGCVDKVMVGFAESRDNYRDTTKVVVTGTPVRGDFFRYSREQARAELGIPADKPLVLSAWGSLGAARMNEMMANVIRQAAGKRDFCLIHSAGVSGYPKMQTALKEAGLSDCGALGYDVREFIYDMARVMAASDLVLCRAGASTLAELAAVGKPAILVPSPNVTNNHQEKNARMLESAGAAQVMLENQFTADELLTAIRSLLGNRGAYDAMSGAMRGLSVDGATDKITELVLDLAMNGR